MRRRFSRWFLAAVASGALALILLPTRAAAQTAHDRFIPGPLLAFVAEQLELTAAQTHEARSVVGARRAEIETAIEGVVAARQALFAAIHAESLDEASVKAASAAVAESELELALVRAHLVQELRPLLTPAQRIELARLRDRGKSLVEAVLARARSRWAEFLVG